MNLNAYSVFDRKALLYYPPYFVQNDQVAIRSLTDEVNATNTAISNHPTDYVLYHVGYYDDQTGKLTPEAPLRHVMDAISLVKLQPALFQPPLDTDLSMRPGRNGAAVQRSINEQLGLKETD